MTAIEDTAPSTLPTPSTTRAESNPRPDARVDMYSSPHRALRYMLANLLLAMGRTTFADHDQAASVLRDLKTALWAADTHIEHEDRHLRPALAARAANAIAILDTEHAEHAIQVAELRAIARSLEIAETDAARAALGETLYLHFSVFVAETLAHMAYEERVVQPLLERLFTTAELVAIHEAIIASIPPPDMFIWLGAMIPSGNRQEQQALMANVRANVPPEGVRALLDSLRPRLPEAEWLALAS